MINCILEFVVHLFECIPKYDNFQNAPAAKDVVTMDMSVDPLFHLNTRVTGDGNDCLLRRQRNLSITFQLNFDMKTMSTSLSCIALVSTPLRRDAMPCSK